MLKGGGGGAFILAILLLGVHMPQGFDDTTSAWVSLNGHQTIDSTTPVGKLSLTTTAIRGLLEGQPQGRGQEMAQKRYIVNSFNPFRRIQAINHRI